MVLGLCRGLLRDPNEAEDAAQQTFLSAHRALLNGAQPRETAAWLATIARNECWARTSARMREPLPTDAIDEVAAAHDPVQEAIRRADLQALWLAIEQLPRQQRDALLLREFGGLRYDELAAALAVSEPSVESLLFRARTRLRARLAALSAPAWLEQLLRLVASGGAPAVATKAVALTLGTAAVTGGAVVAPEMLEHHAPAKQTKIVGRPAVHAETTVAAAPIAVLAPAAMPVRRTRSVEEPRRRGRETEQHDTSPAVHEATRDSDGGEGEHTTTASTQEHESEHVSTPTSVSNSGPGSSNSGSGSSHDGATETTVPTLTVTATETSGDDGHDGSDDGGGGSDGPH